MDTSSGNIIDSSTPEKNPLRISTVINRILEFLPLSDMKNGRLICRQWNSEAEPLLRKKAKILFTADFGTSDYLDYYSDSRLPAVPFTAFKFNTNNVENNLRYLETDVDYFFNKCGKNIKSLELDCINIWKDKDDSQRMAAMNISPWIELFPDNMDKLTITIEVEEDDNTSTRLAFNLENLAGVKSLSLSNCDAIVSSSNNINRIAPSNITMTSVTFLNQSGKLNTVVVNDFVDFSKCSYIKLTIDKEDNTSTRLTFNLENLSRVKSLTLSNCDAIVSSSNNINRIAPSKITMTSVTFLNQSGKLNTVVVNDFVDFSKCSYIKLWKEWPATAIHFDMSKDIVNAQTVEFKEIQVLNSEVSKIKTDSLSVSITPSEAIKMQMKELDIDECSSVNLMHLPQTIEKLQIMDSLCVPKVTVPLNLPNLEYLCFRPPSMDDEGVFETVSWFKNCSNLVDVHLEGDARNSIFKFDVAWLPESLKRLQLMTANFVISGDPVNVEVLSLDWHFLSSKVEKLMQKIIPKILVMFVTFNNHSDYIICNLSEKAEDFISFVRKNTQLEKIVIKLFDGLEVASSSCKERFLEFVGEESSSLCYEFNNQIAKVISQEEFYNYFYINLLKSEE